MYTEVQSPKKDVSQSPIDELKQLKQEFGKIKTQTDGNNEYIKELLTKIQTLEERVENVEKKQEEQQKMLLQLRKEFDSEREERIIFEDNLANSLENLEKELEELEEKEDPESEERMNQIEKDLSLLKREYDKVEKQNMERDLINSCNELQEFYERVELKLSELFLAAKAIGSGLIEKSKNKEGNSILGQFKEISNTTSSITQKMEVLIKNFPSLEMLSFAHENLSKLVPFMGIVTGSVQMLVTQYQDEKNKQELTQIKNINLMLPNLTTSNVIAETVARKLTLRYEHQIKQLTFGKDGGTILLAECAVGRIIDFLKSGEFKKGSDVVRQLVAAVFDSSCNDTIKDPFIPGKKQIPTKLNLNWSDKGIFSQSGIMFDNKFFVAKNDNNIFCNKSFKYGFRKGFKDEIERLELIEEKKGNGLLKSQQSWKKIQSPLSNLDGEKQIQRTNHILETGKSIRLNPKYKQIRVGAYIPNKKDCLSLGAITYDSLGYRRKPVNGGTKVDEFEGNIVWKDNIDGMDEIISVFLEEKCFLSFVFYVQVDNSYRVNIKDEINVVIYESELGQEICTMNIPYNPSLSRMTAFSLSRNNQNGEWTITRLDKGLTDKEISNLFPRPTKINLNIIKAKDLKGVDDNNQYSYPYCYVLFNNQKKETTVKNRTVNPDWNETLSL